MRHLLASVLTFAAVLAASLPGFGAFQVRYEEDTNPEWKAMVDAGHLREEMEGWGSELCRLYDGSPAAAENRVVKFVLNEQGVAGTGGDVISLNVNWFTGVSMSEARGALLHELGHEMQNTLGDYLTNLAGGEDRGIDLGYSIKLDDGTVEHLTEPLAEWVRRLRFAPRRQRQEVEYNHAKACFGLPEYGYAMGFIDYLCRAYGQGMLRNVLYYCSTNKEYKAHIDTNPEYRLQTMWPALTGKTFEQLLDDWKHEPRISDPIFQWTYDGASGIQRCNDNKCSFDFDAGNRSGTLKDGIEDGNWTIAMRGRFSAGSGSTRLITVGSGTSRFRLSASSSATYHTLVAVKEGTTVKVYVDGTGSPQTSSVGGDLGNSVSIATGFDFQDYRMFARALSSEELGMYFTAFPADYDPTFVANARWIGPGSGSLSDAANWECENLNDDPVVSVPNSSSAVVAWGETVPDVPLGTTLPCSSFTVKRWITLDKDIDWRGLSVPVTLDPDATIRTDGHRLAANSMTGTTMRLYGHLACNSLELTGDLIFCGGCVFETPPSSFNMAHVGGALRLQDSLPVFVKIADGNPADGTYEILTADGGLPADISLFRLAGLSGRRTCTFSKSGNTLLATVADADVCVWTGAAGDGKFSTSGNWVDGVKPAVGDGRPIFFASASAGTANNDVGPLSPAYVEFRFECAETTVSGFKLTLPSGAAITVLADFQPNFEAPVEFAGDIRTIGDVRFSGGVSGPDIHAGQTDILGSYQIVRSGMWTPKGRLMVNAGSSLSVDQYRSELRDDSSCCVGVKRGGAFSCRLAQIAQDAMFVKVNHGVVTVSETATFQGGATRITPGSVSTGEFRINKIVVSGGGLEFNARDVNWQDVNSITSNVNMVMGPGGVELSDDSSYTYTWWNRGFAFGCTDDWTFGARPNGGNALSSYANTFLSLYFDTSDHDNHSVKHAVTVEGKLQGDNAHVAAYGGGTIRFSCTDADQFRGGFAALDATTLEYASTSARVGNGDVCLAPGSTLALPAAGSGPVTVAGELALTNGVGTVYVRLGSAGSVVQPGSYSIAIAEGGVDSALLQHLSLANGIRGSTATFGMAADSRTLVATVELPPLELCGGKYLSVPEGGLAFDSFTVTDASRENPVFVLVGDGGMLPDGTNLVLTASSLPDRPPYEYLSLANEMPDSCYAAFWQDGDSIYVSVKPLGWVNEKADSASLTGRWTRDVVYDENGLAKLVGETVFEPDADSTGNVVTVETTLQLNACDSCTPDAAAQAGVRLFTNGCLQVWSQLRAGNGAQAGWVDVEADGLVPVSGGEYTVRFIVNYTANAYSVEIASNATEFASVSEKGDSTRKTFRLASSANCVSSVEINGETYFRSLWGECRLVALGFAEDDVLVLKNNVEIVLSAAKAAWLNKCAGGDKSAVEFAAAGLTEQEFSDAYLLNVDVAGDRSYSLKVTSVEVSDETVSVGVELTRSDKIDQPINGVLKLYGAEALSAFKNGTDAPIATAVVSDETFSNGDTATGEFEIGDEAKVKFLKAKVE